VGETNLHFKNHFIMVLPHGGKKCDSPRMTPPVRKSIYTYFTSVRTKVIFPHRSLLLPVCRRLGFTCSCRQLWTECYFQDVIYCSLWTWQNEGLLFDPFYFVFIF